MGLSEGRRSLLEQVPTKSDIIWVSNNNSVLTREMGSHKSILNMNVNTNTGNIQTRGENLLLTVYFLSEHS